MPVKELNHGALFSNSFIFANFLGMVEHHYRIELSLYKKWAFVTSSDIKNHI
jgi:hypothetical protein